MKLWLVRSTGGAKCKVRAANITDAEARARQIGFHNIWAIVLQDEKK